MEVMLTVFSIANEVMKTRLIPNKKGLNIHEHEYSELSCQRSEVMSRPIASGSDRGGAILSDTSKDTSSADGMGFRYTK